MKQRKTNCAIEARCITPETKEGPAIGALRIGGLVGLEDTIGGPGIINHEVRLVTEKITMLAHGHVKCRATMEGLQTWPTEDFGGRVCTGASPNLPHLAVAVIHISLSRLTTTHTWIFVDLLKRGREEVEQTTYICLTDERMQGVEVQGLLTLHR